MLHIADTSQGLQYSLSQDGVFLFIQMSRAFAQATGPEVGRIAYNNRSRITNVIDIEMMGDFIPYKDGRQWGYGPCLQVEHDGDEETWKLALPPWKEDSPTNTLECIRAQAHAFATLEAVFATLNVPSEIASSQKRQRVEIDLNFDYPTGLFSIKAEVSKQAVERFGFLTKNDLTYVRESMSLAVDLMVPHGQNLSRSQTICSYSTEKPLRLSLGDVELSADGLALGGGCKLAPHGAIVMHQVFGLLVGLAALDELLADLVPPLH